MRILGIAHWGKYKFKYKYKCFRWLGFMRIQGRRWPSEGKTSSISTLLSFLLYEKSLKTWIFSPNANHSENPDSIYWLHICLMWHQISQQARTNFATFQNNFDIFTAQCFTFESIWAAGSIWKQKHFQVFRRPMQCFEFNCLEVKCFVC